MVMTMVGTRLNSSRTDTPARRESYCSKTAERGKEHEASVKDEHNCKITGQSTLDEAKIGDLSQKRLLVVDRENVFI